MYQRLRITYRKTAAAVDVAPRQLSRVWVDTFEAAGISLARPEGAKRARLELAPPLPQAATGERELLDAWLVIAVEPDTAVRRLQAAAPTGVEPFEAVEIGERLPSLSASVCGARYVATFAPPSESTNALRTRVAEFMAKTSIDWEELRGERLRSFDLRALVFGLDVATFGEDEVVLEMHLLLAADRTGRPASVLAALGLGNVAHRLVRTAIEVDQPMIALRAWRAYGRFE